MQVRAIFSEKQPNYRYMPISETMADVFIYKFIEELPSQEDNSIQYVHDMNEFRVNSNEITEEIIAKDPLKYLDYQPEDVVIQLEDRVNALEDAFVEMAEVVYNG